MSDMMTTGVSALQAFRQALNTVSSNISNSSTPGYSRETTALQTTPSGGVLVQQTNRMTDAILFQRSLGDNASYSRLDTFQQLASQIDGLTSGSTTGLGGPLQNFFTALNGLASDPQSTANRQAVLAAANGLSDQFGSLQSQMSGMESNINDQLTQAVSQINQAASSIADLNNRIALSNGGPQAPNALLDQRDALVKQLASNIGITTVKQDDGSINIFTAGGQALVLGSNTQKLSLVPGDYGTGRQEVAIGDKAINVNSQISGGVVGGLLDARSQLLDPAETALGTLAVTLTQAVNQQNAQGVDQNGAMGANIFAPISGSALPSSRNAGSAGVSVGFADVGQLTNASYRLNYDGSSWHLTDVSSGAAVPMTGAGTAASPFVAAGISLQISGAASAGDSYLVKPTAYAAAQVQVTTQDPAKIAAALPISVSSGLGNTGSTSVAVNAIGNAADPDLRSPVTILFSSPSTYSINGSGSYAYSAGQAISLNGWSITPAGAPAAGDSFQVGPMSANSGDNGNAVLLAGLSSKGVLNGGNTSLSAANTAMVSQIGSIAQLASARSDAAQAIQQQTQKDSDAVSGVNLDEEAADLVRYQQAYQAAAQVISTAQNLFQTLLSAARGT
ncbi:MAG TPA: flagellar hook-associated protein FlgK [Stenotrophobium sp.]|nr:flagellar hook-associated protein FlgK [Stenotrophobium sp.]